MMGTLTIRLLRLAESRGISLNTLFEEFSTHAIAESDAYTRFLARAARGDTQQAIATLDRLDQHFEK